MGNCESSLDCTKRYSDKPYPEIEINSDIAGIGVLASFFFSAIGLSVVVVWAYLTGCLPPNLLTHTDHYAAQVFQQSFRTRRRAINGIDLDFEPTPKQTRRSEVVIGFVKVLGDQQLITGLAILIAGLASRCQLSIFEFNIIACLAYFAEITHSLSLRVLRNYLYHHKLVRNCRVVVTIVFLGMFGFSYITSVAGASFVGITDDLLLNAGSKVQCIFDAPRLGKTLHYDIVEMLFLAYVLINHITALVDLYFVPGTTSTDELLRVIFVTYLSKRRNISEVDAQLIWTRARSKYLASFHLPLSSSGTTKISLWFYLRVYYDSYCSILPIIFLGVGLGIGMTIVAVWFDEMKPANGLEILGFGQIVAIGLLSLTILAAVEIVNEQRSLEARLSSSEHESNHEMSEMGHETSSVVSEENTAPEEANRTPVTDRTGSSFPRHPAFLGAQNSQDDLDATGSGRLPNPGFDETNARKVGQFTVRYGLLESCFCIFVSVGWVFDTTSLSASLAFTIYALWRIIVATQSTVVLILFIRNELRLLRLQQRPVSQQGLASPVSAQSAIALVPASNASVHTNQPSLVQTNDRGAELHSIAAEEQMVFGPLDRQDTEADIGLAPPTRRNTFQSADVDASSYGRSG